MLDFLRIQNLALIQDMELEFAPGLNVLTGETGAGKSFILRALAFLTGERMTADAIRPGAEKATVEAIFTIDGEERFIRRELAAESGRSRLYLDDKLSARDSVLALRPKLLLHTSQHAQQRLLKPSRQAEILDSFLDDQSLLEDKEALHTELHAVLHEKEELAERTRDLLEKRDFLEYQKQEIDAVSPKPGEEDELFAKKREIDGRRNASDAVERALTLVSGYESGILDTVGHLSRELKVLAGILPDYEEDASQVEDFCHLLTELNSKLRCQPTQAGDNESEAIESRLFELAQLKRKLRRELNDIVELSNEIDENLEFLDSCRLDEQRLEKKETEVVASLEKALKKLNTARRNAADDMAKALENELRDLGFAKEIKVSFEFEPKELYPGLTDDRGRMFWQPNPGQPAQPLDKIASGGELSRFLLAITRLAAQKDSPTLIFDEVDSGIGGLTLNTVSDRIADLSTKRQILLITHWPQLASKADRHFFISKAVKDNMTTTSCIRLNETAITNELTRMAGGSEHAKIMAENLRC